MGSELVLAIETSCDETAVAVADQDGTPLTSRISSQVALHAPYGGVVPELASRNHNADLRPLIDATLLEAGLSINQIGVVAATSGPGLASSLLIGNTTGKALAVGLGCPFYAINHMEGHLLSPFIGRSQPIPNHLALIVSGGHTLLVKFSGIAEYQRLGSTKDDAAGEAFDKVGKMLGLPYPGGPEIAKRAAFGRIDAFDFPRSMMQSGDLDFSFSGLKTSALHALERAGGSLGKEALADFCASFQEAIIDVLVAKLMQAVAVTGLDVVTVSGGVSCNLRLRERVAEACASARLELFLSDPAFSTDNAAMIAFAAAARRRAGIPPSSLHEDINPNLPLA